MRKKKPIEEQLTEAQQKIWAVLHSVGMPNITEHIVDEIEWGIEYVQDQIESERSFMKSKDFTISAQTKLNSKRLIRELEKDKQNRAKALKQVKQAFALLKKLEDL